MQKQLLFEGNIDANTYLKLLLQQYPYDIEEAFVYSLLSKHTYPHPSLLQFISYFEKIIKIKLCHKRCESTTSMMQLLHKMSNLSQKDNGLLHTHNFNFQASYKIEKHPFSHPYAHLPLHKICFIDEILLHDTIQLPMNGYQKIDIIKSETFIFCDISMDASRYLALSIQIGHKHGLIFISKNYVSLAIPLLAMYHCTLPALQHDFILLFGLADEHCQLSYYFDETNQLYIGLVQGNQTIFHFNYLRDMILTLYNSLCMEQHDLPMRSSMIQLGEGQASQQLLLIGEQGAGKSSLVEAIAQQCQKKASPYHILHDDQATLHDLDNEIKATQVELGAFQNRNVLSMCVHQAIHPHTIYLQEGNACYHIKPLITFEESKQFHCVTHIFYLDMHTQHAQIERIDNLNTCLTLFRHFDHTMMVAHMKKDDLLHDFVTMFYVKNIPVYHVDTGGTRYQKQTLFERLAKCILKEILP